MFTGILSQGLGQSGWTRPRVPAATCHRKSAGPLAEGVWAPDCRDYIETTAFLWILHGVALDHTDRSPRPGLPVDEPCRGPGDLPLRWAGPSAPPGKRTRPGSTSSNRIGPASTPPPEPGYSVGILPHGLSGALRTSSPVTRTRHLRRRLGSVSRRKGPVDMEGTAASPAARVRVAVLGAGNGGLAFAGYFASRGVSVHLYNRTSPAIARLGKPPQITLTTGCAVRELPRSGGPAFSGTGGDK